MKQRTRTAIVITFSVLAGIALAEIGPRVLRLLTDLVSPVPCKELARLPSSDGKVDAVMEVVGCGPMCSDTYLVAIVPRGAKAPSADGSIAFSADDLADAQIKWKQPHLLEIKYRTALINHFQNIAHPFAKFGDKDSWNYRVELWLEPASSGFSYLTE